MTSSVAEWWALWALDSRWDQFGNILSTFVLVFGLADQMLGYLKYYLFTSLIGVIGKKKTINNIYPFTINSWVPIYNIVVYTVSVFIDTHTTQLMFLKYMCPDSTAWPSHHCFILTRPREILYMCLKSCTAVFYTTLPRIPQYLKGS